MSRRSSSWVTLYQHVALSPFSSNVEAMQQFPEPATVKDMKVFLGIVNFYLCFIPNTASMLLPLTDCLRGGLSSSSALS